MKINSIKLINISIPTLDNGLLNVLLLLVLLAHLLLWVHALLLLLVPHRWLSLRHGLLSLRADVVWIPTDFV